MPFQYLIICLFSLFVINSQSSFAQTLIKSDSASIQSDSLRIIPKKKKPALLFKDSLGREVESLENDSLLNKLMLSKPDQPKKPKVKKGVKVSSKDCPVT